MIRDFLNRVNYFFSCNFTRVFYIYIAFIILFLVVAKFFSAFNFMRNLDYAILDFIISLRSDVFTDFITYITMFGDKEIVLSFAFVLLIYLFIRKRYYFFISLATMSVVSSLAVYSIKNFFARERPDEALRLIFADGFSFPSGHAMVAIAFYGILAYFVIVSSQKKWEKYVAFSLACVFIFLVAFSRLYLGVHFPTDIIGSFIIGGIWLFIVIYFTEKVRKNMPM